MKTKILLLTLPIFIFIFVFRINAQNPKKLVKSGTEYSKSGNYEKAIEAYSAAIEIDSKYIKAFEGRAFAYEKIGDLKLAASDYETLSELLPKDYKNGLKAADLFYKSGDYKHSLELILSIEDIAPELPEILALKANCLFSLGKYKDAQKAADGLIVLSPTAENYYLRGLIYAELQNFESAEKDFSSAIEIKADFADAMVQKAIMLYSMKKKKEALDILNLAITIDKKNKKAYVLKSKIHMQNSEFEPAILNLTKLLSFDQDYNIYYLRGTAYMQNQQIPQAIEDYSKVILADKNNYKALEGRADCYKTLNKKEEASKDYAAIVALSGTIKISAEILQKANDNLLELKRESNEPKIMVLNADNGNQKSIQIAEGLQKIKIKLRIIDENRIEKIVINNQTIAFNADSIAQFQEIEINVKNLNSLEIKAEDIYHNSSSVSYALVRRDEGLPSISMSNPFTDGKGSLFLKTLEPEVFLEGQIVGKNLIDSVYINNMVVSIDKSVKNPTFKIKVNLSGLETVNFRIIDSQGNEVMNTFTIDRTDAKLLSENPMGRTWVVFIENSEYKNFSNLAGPKKEVELMIKALSKYKIDKIIHKRNLTKSQMEYFFSHELKNLVIDNRVNSLLIWYAGHGKLMDQNGFWVPIDSKMDDEKSYYNINSLKNTIKPYVKTVTHSLIVTDACETGPGFYMAMRNIPTEKNCSDNKSTKFKSSQVFSSSGADLADGDSQFTSSFANSLMFDNNSCVPIERIVNKVSNDVIKSNNKRPKFGKISGFEDENGTFIFIKK